MRHVCEITIDLPHFALENADWADAYQIILDEGCSFASAREAAEAIFQSFPKVTKYLLVLRQLIMAPFGLKGPKHIETMKIDSVGFFPILFQSDDRVIAGFDDRHLDFRIVVDLGRDGMQQRVKLATIIRRHNWVGKTYLAAILPFHRWIIRSALGQLPSFNSL